MKIAIHFTNSKTAWNKNTPLINTGVLQNILNNGLRKYSNLVLFNSKDEIENAYKFIHHGMRTNKARGFGFFNIPVAIFVDIEGLPYQQGADGKYHIQVNSNIPKEKIISHIEIDPDNIIKNYITKGINPPYDINRLGNKKYIPFLKEFLANKNTITKTLKEGLKMFKITAQEKQLILKIRKIHSNEKIKTLDLRYIKTIGWVLNYDEPYIEYGFIIDTNRYRIQITKEDTKFKVLVIFNTFSQNKVFNSIIEANKYALQEMLFWSKKNSKQLSKLGIKV